MSQAARRLLAALPAEQQAALRFPFDDPGRTEWHYTPGRRRGVSVAEMGRDAAKAVHGLLVTALSRSAHTRVAAITGLEDVLDESEGGRRGRHAGDYWTSLFGEPGHGPWGWRFEGHHVSLNVTVADAGVSATPCFLGANPATLTDEDGRTVSRPLAPEEDVAAALMASLDDGQRERAVLAVQPPDDILSGERPELPRLADAGWTGGLPASALRPDQLSLLRSLAAVYINRLVGDLAEPVLARLERDLPNYCFAWAGPPGPPVLGRPHYYRLAGPRFLAELDNRQNGANHVHSVWRDPGGDFGARLLPEDTTGLS
jgi:Protein of unknown function (DUF3500)